MRRIVLGGLSLVLLTACSNGGSQPTGAASGPRAGATASAQVGAISGRLSYPSEFLAAQAVYAISVDGKSYYRVESTAYQSMYTMLGVHPGSYYVYSARLPLYPGSTDAMHFGAGYTKAVLCGLSNTCTDHSPIAVQVRPSETTHDINVADWYGVPDSLPLIPDAAKYVEIFPPKTFPTAKAAATSLAQVRLIAQPVAAQTDCPINVACFSFMEIGSGHDADYYVALAGSNQDVIRCAMYVVKDQSEWRPLDVRCTSAPKAFPAFRTPGRVSLGMGETGCVRVHSSPGLTARVLACLNAGTEVVLDDVYYQPTQASKGPNGPAATDLWWHIAGRGWMVHQYLAG